MSDLKTIQTKINDLKAKVEENSISPGYLGSILDDIVSQLKDIDIPAMSDDLAEIETKINDILNDITSLKATDKKLRADVDDMDHKTMSANAGVVALNTRMNNAEGNMAGMRSEFSYGIDSLQKKMVKVNNFLNGLPDEEEEDLVSLLEQQKTDIGKDYMGAIFEAMDRVTGESVTWEQLIAKRENSELMPGALYRIMDYVTTVANDAEAKSAGHPFDVLVMALSSDTLSERAWAMRSYRDSENYFEGVKFEAWQIWYCLDNDTSRFQWADEESGKGVIFRMIDEWGNDCPYDFKNVQFKRYYTQGNYVDSVVAPDPAVPNPPYILGRDMTGNAGMTIEDEDTFRWFYTFSSADWPALEDVRDASLRGELSSEFGNEYFNRACTGNEMGPYRIAVAVDYEVYQVQALNNIVLSSCDHVNGEAVKLYGNRWGDDCYNMTLHDHCCFNSFGSECSDTVGFNLRDNTFGNGCRRNTLGSRCYNNTFGGRCLNNTLGYDCDHNTFGKGCEDNTFGGDCNCNTLGDECCENSLGDDCEYNSLGKGCAENKFGVSCLGNMMEDVCYRNTLGRESSYNRFGNVCHDNVLGTYCACITSGSDCNGNEFGKYVYAITMGSRVRYLTVKGGPNRLNSSQKAEILGGTSGKSSTEKLTVEIPASGSVCRFVGLNTAGELKIWAPADLLGN